MPFLKNNKIMISIFIAAAVCVSGGIFFLVSSKSANQKKVVEQTSSPIPSFIPTVSASSTALTTTPSPAPSSVPTAAPLPADLNVQISNYLNENDIDPGNIGIYIHDLSSGAAYTVNPDQYFVAASTYKLPLALYYYERINSGELSLDQVIQMDISEDEDSSTAAAPAPFLSEDPVSGTPDPSTSPLPSGEPSPSPSLVPSETPTSPPTKEPVYYTTTIGEALHKAIRYSDNTAAQALYTNLGGFGDFKNDIAVYSSHVERNIDWYNNEFTPAIMNDILYYIYCHQDSLSELMNDLMIARPYDYLNGNMYHVMYQKYGYYGSARNAVGFPSYGHPYTIAVFTYDLYNGAQVIADINEICFNYFN